MLAAFAVALNEARSPRWLSFVSGRALSINVAHLVVLYGPPARFDLGLIARVGAAVQGFRIPRRASPLCRLRARRLSARVGRALGPRGAAVRARPEPRAS